MWRCASIQQFQSLHCKHTALIFGVTSAGNHEGLTSGVGEGGSAEAMVVATQVASSCIDGRHQLLNHRPWECAVLLPAIAEGPETATGTVRL